MNNYSKLGTQTFEDTMEELKKSYALIVQKINDRDQKISNKENY